MREKLTILIPMYNSEDSIRYCIRCLLTQTYWGNGTCKFKPVVSYKDIRIIIFNDGSTDNSIERLWYKKLDHQKSLAEDTTRIKIITSKKNKGRAYARNMLLDNIETEFGAWQDADDYSHPDRLRIQMDYMNKHPDCDFCCTLMNDYPINRKEVEDYKTIKNLTYEQLLLSNEIPNPTVLFRAQQAKRFKYNIDAEFEDWDYWLQVYRAGLRVECINERLYNYHVRSITQ